MTRVVVLKLETRTDENQEFTGETTLLVRDKFWSEVEPGNAKNIFQTKTGSYNFAASQTTFLSETGREKVGIFYDLDPSKVTVGQSNNGAVLEDPAVNFLWTCASVFQD